jgi:hypothetical protein
MKNNTSQQILPTAANLIGFCLFVITSMHVSDKAASSMVDEFISIITLFLTTSCLLSFLSIRSTIAGRSNNYEKIADYLFIGSLIGLLIIILLLVDGVIS